MLIYSTGLLLCTSVSSTRRGMELCAKVSPASRTAVGFHSLLQTPKEMVKVWMALKHLTKKRKKYDFIFYYYVVNFLLYFNDEFPCFCSSEYELIMEPH